jgi:hypothetical protein
VFHPWLRLLSQMLHRDCPHDEDRLKQSCCVANKLRLTKFRACARILQVNVCTVWLHGERSRAAVGLSGCLVPCAPGLSPWQTRARLPSRSHHRNLARPTTLSAGRVRRSSTGGTIADWIVKTYVKTAVVSGSVTLLRDLVLRMGGRVSEGLPDKEMEHTGGQSMKAEFAERLLGAFGLGLETPTSPAPVLASDLTSSPAMTNPEQRPAAKTSSTEAPREAAPSLSSEAASQQAPTGERLPSEMHAATTPSFSSTVLSPSESRHSTTAATLPPSTSITAPQTAPGPSPNDAPAATSPLVSPTVLSRSESRHSAHPPAATPPPVTSTTAPQPAPAPAARPSPPGYPATRRTKWPIVP